jgi:hypothetical protein
MTREQFLLLKLSEECAEAAQRASKQIQFGKTETQKDLLLIFQARRVCDCRLDCSRSVIGRLW